MLGPELQLEIQSHEVMQKGLRESIDFSSLSEGTTLASVYSDLKLPIPRVS